MKVASRDDERAAQNDAHAATGVALQIGWRACSGFASKERLCGDVCASGHGDTAQLSSSASRRHRIMACA